MSGKRHTEEFKVEAVKQITDRGYSVSDVAERLGVTDKRLYTWLKCYGSDSERHQTEKNQQGELRHLQAELKRVTQEQGILKKTAAYFARASG